MFQTAQILIEKNSLYFIQIRFFMPRRTIFPRESAGSKKTQSWQDRWNAAHPRSPPDRVEFWVGSAARSQQGHLRVENKRQLDKVRSFRVQTNKQACCLVWNTQTAERLNWGNVRFIWYFLVGFVAAIEGQSLSHIQKYIFKVLNTLNTNLWCMCVCCVCALVNNKLNQ